MFGKKKEVKSYEYMVEYCIIGIMSAPTKLTISLKNPLNQVKFTGEADMLFESGSKYVRKTNKDLVSVMGAIFASYAYMDIAEFRKRLVIISIEGGM